MHYVKLEDFKPIQHIIDTRDHFVIFIRQKASELLSSVSSQQSNIDYLLY